MIQYKGTEKINWKKKLKSDIPIEDRHYTEVVYPNGKTYRFIIKASIAGGLIPKRDYKKDGYPPHMIGTYPKKWVLAKIQEKKKEWENTTNTILKGALEKSIRDLKKLPTRR